MGLNLSMDFKGSILAKICARLLFCALFLIVWIPPSFAQEPPLNVPGGNRLAAQDPNAIAVDGWLLYPTLRLYSLYSDNLFFTPTSPLSAGAIGVTPSMAAVWSNGIHTTTLYGNIDRQDYPTANEVNTLDGRAGFTQRYEAMRDLIFTANVNYAHQTWATGLQNSIQTPAAAPTTTVLPNGNTVLPNGTILSPTGQPIGQTSAAAASGAQLFVNPSNQYTGTFSVDKIFNRGILSLSGSVNRTDFENRNRPAQFQQQDIFRTGRFLVGSIVLCLFQRIVRHGRDGRNVWLGFVLAVCAQRLPIGSSVGWERASRQSFPAPLILDTKGPKVVAQQLEVMSMERHFPIV